MYAKMMSRPPASGAAPAVYQFLRFGITGGVVTLVGVATYWGTAELLHMPALLANWIAYLACLALGYVVHGRWSFAADTGKRASAASLARYAVASLGAVGVNSLWVWFLVVHLGGPTWWPILPMIFVTPLLTFAAYRYWVFRPHHLGVVNQTRDSVARQSR